MKYATFFPTVFFLTAAIASAQASPKAAKADLYNAQNEKVGSAKLTQTRKGVRIALRVSKLPPGVHGFHIHEAGKCDPPDFKSAGGHFNPHGKKHGLNNPEGPHAGDLENLNVGPDGGGKLTVVDSRVSLGEGSDSLFHPGGTAIVIHANPDDGKTDPAGNAGARIACGVIGK